MYLRVSAIMPSDDVSPIKEKMDRPSTGAPIKEEGGSEGQEKEGLQGEASEEALGGWQGRWRAEDIEEQAGREGRCRAEEEEAGEITLGRKEGFTDRARGEHTAEAPAVSSGKWQ